MLLSCRILEDVGGVNSFEPATQAEFTAGTALYIYIQLIDASKDGANKGFNPAGRRFVPADGATLQVTVESIDDAKKIVRAATQPYSGDASIWRFSMLATDTIQGTASLRLKLTEDDVITYGTLMKCISIYPVDAN